MPRNPVFPPGGPQRPAKLRRVNRSFPAMRSVMALVLREMSSRYGRSPGGYLWAIMEPLGGILVLSIGFSLLVRTPSLGNSFLLFYATGYLPFQIYMSVSNAVARSVSYSRALLFYPAVTWLDAMIARTVLNSLTGLLVTYILLTGIFVMTETRTVIALGPVALSLALAIALGAGVGAFNCVISGLFKAWEQIWSIAMRPIFIVSGVFFLYEDMPPNVAAILWWNPLLHITGLMRRGIYATYRADYVSITYVLAVSLGALAMGLLLMGRFHRKILNE
ncbi:ABC transporter permease [Palleronia sp. LCG004]|uniref:ABC transporter permease n=1 Tax=Palleronia sp. LCG004 TaxID=3079304 RepID=UPI0029435194|nr:ABC transporter permease [Palleronia sp. LCG004]WOI58380.1 ABC transporter permease [Palleronia sp. LCG004]